METATVHEQEGKKRICTDHFVVLLNGRRVPRHSLFGVLPHLIQHSPLIARAYLQRQKGDYDQTGVSNKSLISDPINSYSWLPLEDLTRSSGRGRVVRCQPELGWTATRR